MSLPPIPLVDMADVPEDMQQCALWVNWRYEERKGKLTKVPVNPHTGGNAASDNPSTWSGLAVALSRARRSVGMRGVGFVLAQGYCGLDLDHVVREDGLSFTARGLLAQWRHTYAEYSPSGAGVHVWFKGVIGDGWNRHPFGEGESAELYDHRRFFTVTGRKVAWHADGVAHVTQEDMASLRAYVVRVHEEIQARVPVRTSSGAGTGVSSGVPVRDSSGVPVPASTAAHEYTYAHEDAGAHEYTYAHEDAGAHEEIRAREGENFDFDYDTCAVEPGKLLEMHKKKAFREHWAQVSDKPSNSERGSGIARLCQQAGWTAQEVCAALHRWCDETGQARYHPKKMRETLTFVFSANRTKAKAPAPRDREQLQQFITEVLGLNVEKIVQKGWDTPSYTVQVVGMERPYIIATYAQFEKRLTWQQLAHSTAITQGYAPQVPVSAKQWPEVLVCLVSLCVPEALEESDTRAETQEWLSQVFDGTTKRFEALSTMSVYDLGSSAFYAEDGTAYLKLAELLRVCQLNGIKVSRSELISRLHNEGWQPPLKGGYSRREGDTVHTYRFWSKPV